MAYRKRSTSRSYSGRRSSAARPAARRSARTSKARGSGRAGSQVLRIVIEQPAQPALGRTVTPLTPEGAERGKTKPRF